MRNNISNKKQTLIDQYNSSIEVGDEIEIDGDLLKGYNEKKITVKVVDKTTTELIVSKNKGYYNEETYNIPIEKYKKNIFFIGENPFKEQHQNLRLYQYSLESVLRNCGVDSYNGVDNKEITHLSLTKEIYIPKLNWNPFVIDASGKKYYYQRNLVWNQQDKQLLIESIYNNINLGKVILRKRDFDWCLKQYESGNKEVCYHDIVDGKQRLDAIIRFILNEFQDLHGNYFGDLSAKAQHKFTNNQLLSYSELTEWATDEDVIETFLTINFTGKQMSKEHLDYVKSIRLK